FADLVTCNGKNGAAGPDAASPIASAAAPLRTAAPVFRESAAAKVGKLLFFDKNLSASGAMSCASCHDPEHAYGPPNDLAVQLGGPARTTPGVRAVPTLRYLEYTPGYSDLLDNPDGIALPAPGGGFTWDGRADSQGEQAAFPLLSQFEMANASKADVVAKVR